MEGAFGDGVTDRCLFLSGIIESELGETSGVSSFGLLIV